MLGVCVGELCAVLGTTSRTTSLDVRGRFVGSLEMILEEDIGRMVDGLLAVELALRNVVDVGNWVSMDVGEAPLRRVDIAVSD